MSLIWLDEGSCSTISMCQALSRYLDSVSCLSVTYSINLPSNQLRYSLNKTNHSYQQNSLIQFIILPRGGCELLYHHMRNNTVITKRKVNKRKENTKKKMKNLNIIKKNYENKCVYNKIFCKSILYYLYVTQSILLFLFDF